MGRPTVTLAELIELQVRLREDAQTSPRTLRQRDQAIGRKLPHETPPTSQLLAWLADTRTPASEQAARRSAADTTCSIAVIVIRVETPLF